MELFLIAVVGGALLQSVTRNLLITGALGFTGYVAWSVYLEFFVPYSGGGASFWPIDIVFAGPCSAAGAVVGGYATSFFYREKRD
jgi:hypothetical protein